MAHILMVEDNLEMLEILSMAMRKKGHSVVTAENGKQGMENFAKAHFDLVVTDIIMPDIDGLRMIEEMQHAVPSIKILAISGGGTAMNFDFLTAASKRGAIATIEKPFPIAEFNGAVDRCLGEGAV